MSPAPRPRLGDILLRAGLVTSSALERALDRQQVQPGRLGSHLLELGAVKEEDLAKALSIQHRIPPFLPSLCPDDPGATSRVPEELARRRRAVPVAWDDKRSVLQVAMADPQDLEALDEIRFASGARRVVALVAPEHVVEREIGRRYRGVEPEPPGAVPLAGGREASPLLEPRRDAKRKALVADPSPRRARAVAALLEAHGLRVTRAGSAAEASNLGRQGGWDEVWVHRDWCDAVPGRDRVYSDPVAEWAESLGPADAFAREAEQLAREAVPAERRARAEETAALVRLLAARSGIGGWDARWLMLRAWRAATRAWELPGEEPAPLGIELARAAVAFARAVEETGSPREAVARLGRMSGLDPDAVTAVTRFVSGADLLATLGGAPRALALLAAEGGPEPILRALEAAGWEVVRGEGPQDTEGFQVVLVPVRPGVEWIESGALPTTPPVFVVGELAHPADMLYALRAGAEDVIEPSAHPEVVVAKLERAAARQRLGGQGVEGSLSDLTVAEVVQVLAHGLRTAVVRIEGTDGSGEIALEQGRVVDARAGDLVGEEAVYAMVAWEEGRFRITPGIDPDRPRTVQGADTEGLLMEGFRRLDESRRQQGLEGPSAR